MKKRLLSLLLAVSMMLSLFPVSAFAEDTGGGNSAPQIVEGTDGTLAIDADGKPYNPTDREAVGWKMGTYLYLTGTGVTFDFSNVTNPVTVSVYVGDADTDTGNTIKGGTFNGNWVYVHRDNKLEDVTVNKGVGLYDTAQIVSGTYNGSVDLRSSSKIIDGTFTGEIRLNDTSEIETCTFTGGQVYVDWNSHAKVKGGTYKCTNLGFRNTEVSNIVFEGKYLSCTEGSTFKNSTFLMSSEGQYASSLKSCTIENSVFMGPVKFDDTNNTITSGIFLYDPSNQNAENVRCVIKPDENDDKGIRGVYLSNGTDEYGMDYSHLINSWYNVERPAGVWVVGEPTIMNGYDKVKVTLINPITGAGDLESADYKLSDGNHTITVPLSKSTVLATHVLPLLSITDEGLPDLTNAYENGGVYYGKGWEYRKLNEDDTEKTLIFTSNEYDKFDLKNKTINCPVLVKGVSLYTSPSFTKNVTFDGGFATNSSYECKFLSSETNPLTITLKNGSRVECGDIEYATIELSENSTFESDDFSNCTLYVRDSSKFTADDFTNSTLNIWGTFSGRGCSNDTVELHNGSSFKMDTTWVSWEDLKNNNMTITAYEGSTIEDGVFHDLKIKNEDGATEPVKFVNGTFEKVTNESADAGVLLEGGYVGLLDAGRYPVSQTGGVFLKKPENLRSEDDSKIHAVMQYSDYSGRPQFYVNDQNVAVDITTPGYDYISKDGVSANGERRGYIFEGVAVNVSCPSSIMNVTTDPDVEGFVFTYTYNDTVTFTMPAADVHVDSFQKSSLKTDENGLPDYEHLNVVSYTANGKSAWKGDGWKYEWRDELNSYCVVVPSNNTCSEGYSSSSTNQKLSCPLIVEADGSFSWSGTIEGPVYNSGSVGGSSSTYTGTVYNLDVAGSNEGGTIVGGKFTGTVYNSSADSATHNAVISGGTYSNTLVNYGKIKSSTLCTGTIENHGTIAGGIFVGTVTETTDGQITGGIFTTEQSSGTDQVKIVLDQSAGENHFTKINYNDYIFPEDVKLDTLYTYGHSVYELYVSAKTIHCVNGAKSSGFYIPSTSAYVKLSSSFKDPIAVVSGDSSLTLVSEFPIGSDAGKAYTGGYGWYYTPADSTNGAELYLRFNTIDTVVGTLSDEVTVMLNNSVTLNSSGLTISKTAYLNSSDARIKDATFDNGLIVTSYNSYIHGGVFNSDSSGVAVKLNYKDGTSSSYGYIYNGTFNGKLEHNSFQWGGGFYIYGGIFNGEISQGPYTSLYNGFFMSDTPLNVNNFYKVTGGFYKEKPTGTTKDSAVFYKISDENGYNFTITDIYTDSKQTVATGNSETFTNAYTVKGTKVCVTTESKVTHVKVNDTVTPVADFLSANGGTTSTDGMTLTFTMPEGDVELQTVPIDWNCDIVLNEEGVPTTSGGNGWSYSEDDGLVIEPGYTADLSDADGGPQLVSVPVKAKDETGKTTTIKGGIFTNDVDLGGNKLEDSLVFGDITATNPVDSKELNVPANSKVNGVPCPGGTVKVIGDVLLKVEWPAGTTDQHWTAKDENDADLAAGDLLESGSFKDAEIDFKMGSHSKLTLALEDNPPPVLDYAITVTLPEDDDLANLTAADVVKVKVGGSAAQRASAGDLVELSFEAGVLPAESTKQFVEWKVTDAYGDVTVKNADHMQAGFEMPAGDVTVTFTLKGANDPNPDDKPADGDGIGEGVAVVLGVAAAGGVAYAAGTQIWLETHLPDGVIPTNREQLALILWKQADKPAPQSSTLYTDMAAADTDGQQAARWCVEQGLMKDFNDGEIFKPGDYVFRPQVIKAWCDLQDLLNADAEQ